MSRRVFVIMSPDSWFRIVSEVIVGKVYPDTNVTQKDVP